MQCLGSAWIIFCVRDFLLAKKFDARRLPRAFLQEKPLKLLVSGAKGYYVVVGALWLKLHKFQVCHRPRYQKNFWCQNFSEDRSKLFSKGSFSQDLAKLLLSSSTMYLKRLQETSDYRVCRVLAWSSNVFAKPNWPRFVFLFPVCKTKDTQSVQVTNEPQYGSLFR